MGSAYADIGTMRDGNNRIEPGPQRHASRFPALGLPRGKIESTVWPVRKCYETVIMAGRGRMR